jgi:formyl-CoA transferase
VARVAEIDAAIGAWAATRTVDEVLAALDAAAVPAGRIYTVADIAADPHYRRAACCDTDAVLRGIGLTPAQIQALPGHRGQHLKTSASFIQIAP